MVPSATPIHDPACRACPRLAAHLDEVRVRYPDYHAAPVGPFGDGSGRFLIVGLAPGLHGANATGRPFTGDAAGILLYRMLYRYGFSNQEVATSANDGLALFGARITNAVKCLPPGNRPNGQEVRQCNGFLRAELGAMPEGGIVLALGQVAHQAVLRAAGVTLSHYPFGHGERYAMTGFSLVSAYHPSQYNVRTGRLTEAMLDNIFAQISEQLRPAEP